MRVVRTVAGLVLLTIGLPVLLVGGALWTLMQHRDAGGAFSGIAGTGFHVRARDRRTRCRHAAPRRRRVRPRRRHRLRLTVPGETFLGLAPAAEVRAYLAGAAYSRVDGVTVARGDLPVRIAPVGRRRVGRSGRLRGRARHPVVLDPAGQRHARMDGQRGRRPRDEPRRDAGRRDTRPDRRREGLGHARLAPADDLDRWSPWACCCSAPGSCAGLAGPIARRGLRGRPEPGAGGLRPARRGLEATRSARRRSGRPCPRPRWPSRFRCWPATSLARPTVPGRTGPPTARPAARRRWPTPWPARARRSRLRPAPRGRPRSPARRPWPPVPRLGRILVPPTASRRRRNA